MKSVVACQFQISPLNIAAHHRLTPPSPLPWPLWPVQAEKKKRRTSLKSCVRNITSKKSKSKVSRMRLHRTKRFILLIATPCPALTHL